MAPEWTEDEQKNSTYKYLADLHELKGRFLLICARIISIDFDLISDFTFVQRFKKVPTIQHSNYYGLLLK